MVPLILHFADFRRSKYISTVCEKTVVHLDSLAVVDFLGLLFELGEGRNNCLFCQLQKRIPVSFQNPGGSQIDLLIVG